MNEPARATALLPPEYYLRYPNVEDGLDMGPRAVVRRYDCDAVVVGTGAGGAPAAARPHNPGHSPRPPRAGFPRPRPAKKSHAQIVAFAHDFVPQWSKQDLVINKI